MSVIRAVQAFVGSCPYIQDFTGYVQVDFTGEQTGDFGVSSSGETVLDEDFTGTQLREHHFALYARRLTQTDEQRISNTEFLENFTNWLWEKSRAGELPVLGDGETPDSMAAAGGGMFQAEGNEAEYQIQFSLTYEKRRTM